MIRQKIKGTKVRKSLSPEDEPNFYDMEAQNQITDPSANVRKDNTKNFNPSTSSPQSRLEKSSIPTNALSSEESLVSLVPSAPLDPFETSINTRTSGNPSTRIVTPASSLDSKMELLPSQSAILPSTSRIVSPHYSDPWAMYDEVKAGDLLYFEGLPFRYLEHFEAVPANQQNDKTKALQLSKKTRCQPPRSHPTCDAPTDVFQERISKIVFNYDSSRGFPNDLMQNTSCRA